MKNKMKYTAAVMLICSLFALILSSCSRDGLKTIIIQKPETSGKDDVANNTNDQIRSGNIYKYSSFNIVDNNPVNEILFGWFDNDNAAGILYKENNDGAEVVLESMDYRYHFSEEIMEITPDIINYSLSPDGSKLAYVKNNGQSYLKDLKEQKDILSDEMEKRTITSGSSIAWSNNGRYLSISAYDTDSRIGKVYIYDVLSGISRDVEMNITSPIQMDTINATVSDDGSKLLIGANWSTVEYKYQYFIGLYDLNKTTFMPTENIETGSLMNINFCFLNSDKLIFINLNTNTLCMYDINNSKIAELQSLPVMNKFRKNIQCCKVSPDGKNIIYTKDIDDKNIGIYTAQITGSKLENEKLIYQGFLPDNICWSPGNNKVLLSGRYLNYHDELEPSANAGYSSLENLVIELN